MSPLRYPMISAPPSFDVPYTRSTNDIGTSATRRPAFLHRTMISIWNTYPLLFTLRTIRSNASLR